MLSPIVYCGPMWGGKTEALISRLVRARIQSVRVKAFNPAKNVRDETNLIRAHSGATFHATGVESGAQILELATDADVVGIDEIFMLDGIVDAVRTLTAMKKKVVMATLDMDSEGQVWEPVGELLGMAQEVVKCPAVCSSCKSDAYYTFRRADAPDERLLVGASDYYEPRCFTCWSSGQDEKKSGRGQRAFFRNTPTLPSPSQAQG